MSSQDLPGFPMQDDARAALEKLGRRSGPYPWGPRVIYTTEAMVSDGPIRAVCIDRETGALVFDLLVGFRAYGQACTAKVYTPSDAVMVSVVYYFTQQGDEDYDVTVIRADGAVCATFKFAPVDSAPMRLERGVLRLRLHTEDPGRSQRVRVSIPEARVLSVEAPPDRMRGAWELLDLLPISARYNAWSAEHPRTGRAATVLEFSATPAQRDAVLRAWAPETSPARGGGVLAYAGALPDDGRSVSLLFDALPGLPLTELLRTGPIPLYTVRAVAEVVAHALGRYHAAGRFYGRLSHDKVWVDDSAVALVELGLDEAIMECAPDDPERPMAPPEALRWLSPEVVRGQRPDARSDVWSYGMMVFAMWTGRDFWLPRARSSMQVELLLQIMDDAIPLASERARALGVPDARVPGYEFDEWFRVCVARDPRERHPDLATALAGLDPVWAQPA